MKRFIKLCLLCLSFCVLLISCKKDALKVNEEKVYHQVNAAAPTDPMFGTAIYLSLKPNGVGYINPGGDIVWAATYKISGKKLTVKITDTDSEEYKFTIISDEELHGSNGEILKLFHR